MGRANSSGRRLFYNRGLRAKKSFGQCFLTDANIARRIAQEAIVSPCTALEIGAGTGALTSPLLDRAKKVIAIERDRDLVPILKQAFAYAIQSHALEIHELDAANCDWLCLLSESPRPYVIVGNVPYRITGRLIERATELAAQVDRVVFMIQKEVADRIAAPCGSKNYGALSVFVRRSFYLVRRIAVPPTCFRPQPAVHSAVVVLEPLRPTIAPVDFVLKHLVLTSFSRRRKTLRNAWRDAFELSETQWKDCARATGIALDLRAENLKPEDFDRVAQWVRKATNNPILDRL